VLPVWVQQQKKIVYLRMNIYSKQQSYNNNHKTTIIKQNIKIILIVQVPSSQALLRFLITAPPSVCVPVVLGALAVWIQNQKNRSVVIQT